MASFRKRFTQRMTILDIWQKNHIGLMGQFGKTRLRYSRSNSTQVVGRFPSFVPAMIEPKTDEET